MYKTIQVSDFLHRRKESITIKPNAGYDLVTVKLHHKGVVLREKKRGSQIGSAMFRVSKGQFILSGIDARNGAFGIVPDSLDGAIITNDFWSFDVDEAVVKRDFFYWLTSTPFFLDACIKSSKGETQRIRLQKGLFFDFEFRIPSLKEQGLFLKRIKRTDFRLTEINHELTNQSDHLGQLRKTVLQEAFEGKLTVGWRKQNPKLNSGDKHASKLLEKIRAERNYLISEGKARKGKSLPPVSAGGKSSDLPDGWVLCRLGDWGITQTGTTPSTFDSKNFGDYIPFIKPADVALKSIDYANESLSEKGLHEGRLIAKNSVLMVCIGGSIGKSFFTDRDVSCNQQINSVTPLAKLDARLLQYFLQSKYFQFEVWDKAMKSSTPIINKGKWERIPLPMPPLAEQREILERLDRLMGMIDELEKQVVDSKQYAQDLMRSVLKEAFEG